MSADWPIPSEFVPVAVDLANGEGDVLGYEGNARYVGFYWEPAADVLAAYDGRSLIVGQGQPGIFIRQVIPFSYLYGVNLGTRGEATHFFVWDRLTQSGYLAPWTRALDFLAGQDGMPMPPPNAGGAQAAPPPLA